MLTSQLESQRIYWENKIVRIEKDTAEEINNMKTKFKETIEKCDSLELRLSDLLKEKQSVERKCTQLNTRVAKLSTELQEEQELNKCLRANQLLLQNKLKEEEKLLKETCAQKDLQITEIQEQLRDVMFYLETQQQISHLPAETRQEIQEGQINIAMAYAPNPPSSDSPRHYAPVQDKDVRRSAMLCVLTVPATMTSHDLKSSGTLLRISIWC